MKESMRPGKACGMLTMMFSYLFLPSGLRTGIFMLHKRLLNRHIGCDTRIIVIFLQKNLHDYMDSRTFV